MLKQQKVLVFLLPFFLTGCLGRTIIYEPGFPQKEVKPAISKSQTFRDSYKSFILKHNPKLDPAKAENIVIYVSESSLENDVDPKLVLALMARESSFRADVVSPSGAIGLGQLKELTAKDMGIEDPYDPRENSRATVKYLSWLLKKSKGSEDIALASYKMGPGTVDNLISSGTDFPEQTIKYISDIKRFRETIVD